MRHRQFVRTAMHTKPTYLQSREKHNHRKIEPRRAKDSTISDGVKTGKKKHCEAWEEECVQSSGPGAGEGAGWSETSAGEEECVELFCNARGGGTRRRGPRFGGRGGGSVSVSREEKRREGGRKEDDGSRGEGLGIG